MASKHRSAEKESFWRLALEEFRASGLSVRAFCAREGLAEASFYAWRRTLPTRDADKSRPHKLPPELIPVEVIESTGIDTVLELTTPGGYTLRFPPHVESERLAAVLAAIAGETSC